MVSIGVSPALAIRHLPDLKFIVVMPSVLVSNREINESLLEEEPMKAFVCALALVLISSVANAATWQCDSIGGWSLDSQGRSTQIPADPYERLVIKFVPPNRMQVIQAATDFEASLYTNMTWSIIGNANIGQGVVQSGNVILNVSEILTDTESTMAAIV